MPTTPATKPPTSETGSVSSLLGGQVPGWATLIEEIEWAPDLMWPHSVLVFDKMMGDSQLRGLRAGVELPLRKFHFKLDPNGARPEVVQKLSKDYNLPVLGKEDNPPLGRRRQFRHSRHLEQSLRALWFGFYPFEQVGEYENDGFWHIRKLAERPPRSLVNGEIKVAKDGGLEGIRQSVGPEAKPIPVGRLLYYVWDKEGANWLGRSMLRACFKNWLIKDKLLRVDASKQERNGMGVPWINAPPGASKEQIERLEGIATSWKSGEEAGGAGPAGTDPKLIGVTGNVPDTIASIRYQDEQMAVNFLEQFGELGRAASGSYALGETLFDFFAQSLDAIAEWHCDTFTEHQIEDDVEWNWGPDEQPPQLVYDRGDDEKQLAVLTALVKEGVIKVDDELEASIREKLKLPAKPEEPTPTPPPAVPPPPPPQNGNVPPEETQPPETTPGEVEARRRDVRAEVEAPSPPLSLPARQLRRQPYDHEVQASVDFAAMDSAFTVGTDTLVSEVTNLRRQQIQTLHDAIIAAKGDLDKLSKLVVDPVAGDAILARMQQVADQGIEQAAAEASRQGVAKVKRPGLAALEDSLALRAKVTDELLARALAEVASRRALALTGGELTAADVAAKVAVHLETLGESWLTDQLGGALQQAMNSGRKTVMDQNKAKEIYASELLDGNTCEECVGKDGTQYTSVAEAEMDYPTGGYADCLGGPRCRGTLVAIYETEVAPTLES